MPPSADRRTDLEAAASRLRTALELAAFGQAMKLQQLAREHPGEGQDQLHARLLEWSLRVDEEPGPSLEKRRSRRVG